MRNFVYIGVDLDIKGCQSVFEIKFNLASSFRFDHVQPRFAGSKSIRLGGSFNDIVKIFSHDTPAKVHTGKRSEIHGIFYERVARRGISGHSDDALGVISSHNSGRGGNLSPRSISKEGKAIYFFTDSTAAKLVRPVTYRRISPIGVCESDVLIIHKVRLSRLIVQFAIVVIGKNAEPLICQFQLISVKYSRKSGFGGCTTVDVSAKIQRHLAQLCFRLLNLSSFHCLIAGNEGCSCNKR